MRINKFLAQATGISRRTADAAISAGDVIVKEVPTASSKPAQTGQNITPDNVVVFQNKSYTLADIEGTETITILFNKPAGYVVSRNGQGSRTIYELLPPELHHLKPVGRLDKESSGLLLITNDGTLAHELTHPSRHKTKRYEITLSKPLQPLHRQMVSDFGIQLEDGLSKLHLDRLDPPQASQNNTHASGSTSEASPTDNTSNTADRYWLVTMHEGRNRQIRRTFGALGYDIVRLHRIQFGDFFLDKLQPGTYRKNVQLNAIPRADNANNY